jgi:hypothetical protein
MRHAPAATVGTYAYVNPVVAVGLGWWLAGERLGVVELAAATLIVGSVAAVVVGGSSRFQSVKSRETCAERVDRKTTTRASPTSKPGPFGPRGGEDADELPSRGASPDASLPRPRRVPRSALRLRR